MARTRFNFSEEDCYRSTAYSIRDRLIETLNDTNSYFFEKDFKRCYYLSLEFLVGRAMQNALVNLDIEDPYKKALAELGYNLENLYEYEHDAALGNGGLGRLAACFLDSMASMNYPCWGYGIRYTYGIFEQKIVNGRQVEHPDYWLIQDNPWEIQRQDITYAVRFNGDVNLVKGSDGKMRHKWTGGQLIQAMAYDNPIPGFDTYNCINMRLWKAAPSREFDFNSFNAGKYLDAIAERQEAECISAVLYPNDESEEGKILRLKQQYFFCCATIQDVLRRFKLKPNRDWRDLPNKISIQLNDTHPAIAIPELMRILVDIECLEWDFAWNLTSQVFSYTNHTVLPEALEKWPADLLGKLLPRHLLIINEINLQFLNDVRSRMGDVWDKVSRMSIYSEEWNKKMIRMANLAVIGSHKVNGVAAIHTSLVKRDLFPEFVEYYTLCGQPNKFINVTNGVTPRRWIHCANRPLSNLISEWLGCDDWLKDLDILQGLHSHIEDEQLISEWQDVKLRNKKRLAKHIEHNTGISLDPVNMLFDVQVKRIHEYKRQTLNCFYAIHRYLTIKMMTAEERKNLVPRATMLGGKAAPGYFTAKTIIKMVNNIANVINGDPDVSPYLKVVYIPNYNVSQAMIIVPAADINQQISTAGTEASGTSNMKFVMNGSMIIGTLDGATVEIREECGEDTVFLFGAREEEVENVRSKARNGDYSIDRRLRVVFDWIKGGHLSLGDNQAHAEFCELIDTISNNCNGTNGDFYLCCHDFPDYIRANDDVDRLYKDQKKWTQLTIKAAGAMGKFSTDRTIKEYASLIWDLEVGERPTPSGQQTVIPVRPVVTPPTTTSTSSSSPEKPTRPAAVTPSASIASTASTETKVIETKAAVIGIEASVETTGTIGKSVTPVSDKKAATASKKTAGKK